MVHPLVGLECWVVSGLDGESGGRFGLGRPLTRYGVVITTSETRSFVFSDMSSGVSRELSDILFEIMLVWWIVVFVCSSWFFTFFEGVFESCDLFFCNG